VAVRSERRAATKRGRLSRAHLVLVRQVLRKARDHCEQAKSPYTPRAGGKNSDVLLQDGCSATAQCFSTAGSLARHTRPDSDPSRSVLDGAGYVPPPEESSSKDFWTVTAPPR
jgi:hypothetical protein